MKIMYLVDQLYLHGGIEKILAQKICSLINDYAHDVTLVTYRHKHQDFVYDIPPSVHHIDLDISYDLNKSYFKASNICKTLRHFIKLRKVIRSINPDIIISTSFTPDQYFLPIISNKIPIVKEIHNSGIFMERNKSFLLRFLVNATFVKYNSVVVLNKDEIKYFPKFPIAVIPNFLNSYPELVVSEKKNIIIAAGRIAPVKQFDHLIIAWSKIARNFPNWQLHIYGDGDTSLVLKLKELIVELELLESVSLLPATSDIYGRMCESKIYAMTSVSECFPMVLLEAQSAHLAIISYDCPNGPRNILNGCGVLVEDQNIEQFSNSLSDLLGNNQTIARLSACSQTFKNLFEKSTVMAQWELLFKQQIHNAK